ncbi:unnamed protein product, partial [Arabidopsis halleri]
MTDDTRALVTAADLDARMEDVGRPPGEGIAGSKGWVEKVQGSIGGGIPAPESVLADEFVASRMRLEFPNGEEGEPEITIGQEVLEAMNVTGGPWRVFGSILMVKAWEPNFDPLRDEIVTTPVWVRISNLPLNFYHRAILMGIAEGVGKPLRVDLTTLKVERARFARVCVEVNLRRALKGSIVVNGERYSMAYEGLSNICPVCGIYGHVGSVCPKRESGSVVQTVQKETASNQNGGEKTVDGFTEVRRKGRQAQVPKVVFAAGGPRDLLRQQRTEKADGNGFGAGVRESGAAINANRFAGLVNEGEEQGMQVEQSLMGANKENADSQNMLCKVSEAEKKKGQLMTGKGPVEKGGLKGGELEKQGIGSKQGRSVSLKGRNMRVSNPMRGLVFGPVTGEAAGFVSGKRLRVEHENVGRRGGAYVMKNLGSAGESSPVQARTGIGKEADSSLAVGKSSLAITAHESQSGGLWLLWRSTVGSVDIVIATSQFIHAKVLNGEEVLHLVVVYAAPSVSRRSGLWEELKDTINTVDGPLIIGGDFNTILRLDERTGGNGRLSSDSLTFGQWINELSLIDLGFKGGKYTWKRGKTESTFVAKRLDRVLCCPQARLKWQEAGVRHLPFLASDHAPLYVQLKPDRVMNPQRRPFRFEAAWLKHESFKELLTASWDTGLSTLEALEKLQ